jgi:teichuronic acid biosynthesis glycosyltransferase TuaC
LGQSDSNDIYGKILKPIRQHGCSILKRVPCYETSQRPSNISVNRKILLTVGSLIQSKGHLDLIEAVGSLPPELNAELYVIGGPDASGDDSSQIRERIRELGLTNVHLLGPRPNDELALWYNAADVFCLASKGEGCPNVVLEALACGTPVVVSNVGAEREIICPDESGIIVDIGNRDQLAAAVRNSLTRAWDRDRISRTMRDRTWDACARDVIRVYEKILNRPLPLSTA